VKALTVKLANLVFGTDPNCIVCGTDVVAPQYGLCENCLGSFPFADQSLIQKCFSVARYEPPVKQLIYDYKYNDQRYLGKYMAQMMAAKVEALGLAYDYVLTVPSNEKRKKIRGFDHTLNIAQVLSDILNIDCGATFLQRTRETQRLKGLTKAERLVELDNVFEVEGGAALKGQRILLIDDILTTGATLSACTTVLLEHQPQSIHWLTFAIVV
jgi:ComF family protein